MKSIHYKEIFKNNPEVQKQFDILQSIFKVLSYEDSIEHIKTIPEHRGSSFLYKIQTLLNEDIIPNVQIPDNLLMDIDNICYFVAQSILNNGIIDVICPIIENQFPHIDTKENFNNFNELDNFSYGWEDEIKEINEEHTKKDMMTNNTTVAFIKRYLEHTPEEQTLYINTLQDQIINDIKTVLLFADEPIPNLDTVIIDIIKSPNTSLEQFNQIERIVRDTANFDNNIGDLCGDIYLKIKDELPKYALKSSQGYLKYRHLLSDEHVIPDNIVNDDILNALSLDDFNSPKNHKRLSANWLSDSNNLKKIQKLDRVNRSSLINLAFRKDVYSKYSERGEDGILDFIINGPSYLAQRHIIEKEKELLDNPKIFRECFRTFPQGVKKITSEKFSGLFIKYLETENISNFLGNNITREFEAFLTSYIGECAKEIPKNVIEKLLPYIYKNEMLINNQNIINKIDYQHNRTDILKSVATQYNYLFSKHTISYLEKNDSNVKEAILEINPLLYKEDIFSDLRNKKNTIQYINKSITNKAHIDLNKIPKKMFFDIEVCIKLVIQEKDYTEIFPKEHFSNLKFIIPYLNKIQHFDESRQMKLIAKLPQVLQKFLETCPKETNKSEYFFNYLKMKKIREIEVKATPQLNEDDTTQKGFKI